MQRSMAQYMYHQDKKLYFEPKVLPDHYAFVDKPPFTSDQNLADGRPLPVLT